jgi:hypothetical protein
MSAFLGGGSSIVARRAAVWAEKVAAISRRRDQPNNVTKKPHAQNHLHHRAPEAASTTSSTRSSTSGTTRSSSSSAGPGTARVDRHLLRNAHDFPRHGRQLAVDRPDTGAGAVRVQAAGHRRKHLSSRQRRRAPRGPPFGGTPTMGNIVGEVIGFSERQSAGREPVRHAAPVMDCRSHLHCR